ncbi:MAG: hypothetical protein EXS63_00850 [Candidatus Omnitrophica bacterium]|nr:hypothetical protein [Candidatus Omnitrophota bacterium]
MAEESVGRVLRANVEIKTMNLGSYNEIDVSGLQIHSPSVKSSYQIRVQNIVFRFDPLQILLRKVRSPSEIVFKAPKMLVESGEIPYNFFNSLGLQAGKSKLSNLSFQGGEVVWTIPYLKTKIEAHGMRGKLSLMSSNKLQVFFETSFTGAIQGKAVIHGTIDPQHHTHHLEIDLQDVELGDKIALPFKSFRGHLRWENQNIFLDFLEAKVQGWDTVLYGSLENYNKDPQLFLNWRLKEGPLMRLEVNSSRGSFEARVYNANLLRHTMNGNVTLDGGQMMMEDLHLNHRYEGHGSLDLTNGKIALDMQRPGETQRLSLSVDYQRSLVDLSLQLDHYRFLDLDCIIHGRMKLEPIFYAGDPKLSSLKGSFISDNLVLEYMPLRDFKSQFSLSATGLDHFEASWGDHFQASGEITVSHHDWSGNMAVQIHDFDMGKINRLATKPLSHSVSGVLDGKLKIEGNLLKPECLGQFTVHDGRTGDLTYDRAYIQFSGVPPVLVLNDSKAFKGRNRFNLKGSIDFSLPNIFNGILVQAPDRWTAWKESEFNPNQSEDTDIQNKNSSLPALAIKIASGGDRDASQDSKRKEPKDESFFGVGPKIKF